MKKTICVLLVLALVVGSVFATPTISGRFGVRYTLTYADKSVADATRNYMTLTDSTDFWSLNFKGMGFNYGGYSATATLNLDKILATADIELPVGVSADIGFSQGLSAGYVYMDPTGNDDWYLNLTGAADQPVGLDITYENIDVYAAVGFESDKARGFGLGVIVSDVVEGVDVQAAYAYAEKAITASVAVDVAKLAKIEDFSLSAGGFTRIEFADMADNQYVGGIKAGFGALSAYAEYRYGYAASGVSGIYAGGSYKINNMFTAGASFNTSDITAVKTNWAVSGYLQAKIGVLTTRVTVGNKNVQAYTQFTF